MTQLKENSNEDIIQLSFPEPDIALVLLDTPNKSANVISTRFLNELESCIAELEKKDDLTGVIVASAKSTFVVGADIREFVPRIDMSESETINFFSQGKRVFPKLSNSKFISVAAVNGACVGGGAEIAIWCDGRVLSNSPRTQFGFPEVKLGLIPGWGATVRTPRIAGIENSMELIAFGEPIDSAKSPQWKIADELTSPEQLIEKSIEWIRKTKESGKLDSIRSIRNEPISQLDDIEISKLVTRIENVTGGNVAAYNKAIEVIQKTAQASIAEGMQIEAEGMAEVFGSSSNRALLNYFFLNDNSKKLATKHAQAKKIESVGIVGAGIMGQGIAVANLKRKLPVELYDLSSDTLSIAKTNVAKEASSKGERIDEKRFKTVESATDLVSNDLIIETIIENKDIKQKFFSNFESVAKADTILASNTSTIPISEIAKSLEKPGRFAGLHFFWPVAQRRLVEIIRGEKTDEKTISSLSDFVKRIGKIPVVVNDGPGFLVNRLLFPYSNEALKLIEDGVALERIDRVAKDFGMPIGPLELFDRIGLDTAAFSGKVMLIAFYHRAVLSPVLPKLVKSKRFGEKSGSGFFKYDNPKNKCELDDSVFEIIGQYITDSPMELSDNQITERLFLPMLVEATQILQDGIVQRPSDIDLAIIHGLAFPAFRGGLLFWADSIGASKIIEMLKPYEELGPRYHPTPMLLEMAKENRRFYQLGE